MGDIADLHAGWWLDGYSEYWEVGDCGPQEVTCRNCGTVGLYWEESRGRWFLHDGKRAHRCDYGIARAIQRLKEVTK